MAGSAEEINSRFAEETTQQQAAESAAGAAAATTTTTDDKSQEQQLLDKTTQTAADAGKAGGSAIPEDIAKELEELRQYKQQNPLKETLSPEQKAEQEKQYQQDLIKFGLDKSLLTPEDLGRMESLKQQQDNDIVFGNFKENFKTINPTATDDEIKEAFDQHYHLNSENEHLKKLGENRLKSEAEGHRTPYQSKFESTKKAFDAQRTADAKVPDFDKFLQKTVKDHTPENWSAFKTKDGEEDIEVNYQLSEEHRKKILEISRNSDNFALFLKDPQQATQSIQKQVEAYIRLEDKDKIDKAIFDRGLSQGTKKGSTTGAENSFAVQQQKTSTANGETDAAKELQDSDDRMRTHRQQYG